MYYFPFTIFVSLFTNLQLLVMSKKFKDLVHLKVYDFNRDLVSDELGDRVEMISKFNNCVSLATTLHFDRARFFEIVSGNHVLYSFGDVRHCNFKG